MSALRGFSMVCSSRAASSSNTAPSVPSAPSASSASSSSASSSAASASAPSSSAPPPLSASGTSTSVLSARRRRPRSPSLDAEAAEEARQRKRQFALDVSRDLGVSPDGLVAFAKLDTDEMLILMHGNVLKLFRDSLRTDFSTLLGSTEFQENMTDRLHVILVTPDNVTLVEGSLSRTMSFIKAHFTLFSIPGSLFSDVAAYKALVKFVSEALTTIRSNIKTKIHNSLKKDILDDEPVPISELSRQIVARGTTVSAEHLMNIAWWRHNLRDHLKAHDAYPKKTPFDIYSDDAIFGHGTPGFEPIPEVEDAEDADVIPPPPPVPTEIDTLISRAEPKNFPLSKFYNFVDAQTKVLREMKKRTPTMQLKAFYTEVLQKDLRRYPEPDSANAAVSVVDGATVEWQRVLEDAYHSFVY